MLPIVSQRFWQITVRERMVVLIDLVVCLELHFSFVALLSCFTDIRCSWINDISFVCYVRTWD